MQWILFAFLSALFAAVTAILAKIGVQGINSNLATAIRTVVILAFAWGIVLFQGTHKELPMISRHTMLFLVLSGITTGLSWLFYFRALQLGDASRVVPIDKFSLVLTLILAVFILKERVTPMVVGGTILMTVGTLLVTLGK